MAFVRNSKPVPFSLPLDPEATALLMIDFQGDFCDEEQSFMAASDDAEGAKHCFGVLESARCVLDAARAAKIRVIHTLESHLQGLEDLNPSKDRKSRLDPSEAIIGVDFGNGRTLVRGSKCNSLMPQVAFKDGEVAVHKPGYGAFCNTEMSARLEGVSHLIVAGVTTETCVQTTIREASDRGFNIIIIEDATASGNPKWKTDTLEQLTAYGGICSCSCASEDIVATLQLIESASNAKPLSLSTPVTSSTNPLPVIDVSPLVKKLSQPFTAARLAVDKDCLACAREIDLACRRIGFFYVKGHGLELPLKRAEQFFDLPLEMKMALKAAAGEGAGYEESGAQILDEGRLGEGVDGDASKIGDRKESYIVGKSAPSQRLDHSDPIEGRWPESLDGFKEALVAYHDEAEAFLRTLLRGVALGLGLAADTFDCFTKDSMTKLRLLRYPPSNDEAYSMGAFGCGAHTDWGALTLLGQDSVGGLEVCFESESRGMEWLPVPNIEGALLVNVGDMLKLWTMSRYRSAPHRVVKPVSKNTTRHSIAVFYNCDCDAPIDPRVLFPNKELEKEFIPLTSEEYILERVKETYS